MSNFANLKEKLMISIFSSLATQMSLGVLGSRNALTKQIIQSEILNPILDDIDRPLRKIILQDAKVSVWTDHSNKNTITDIVCKADFIHVGAETFIVGSKGTVS